MAKWRCVKNCGACCYLDPSERPDLENYLTREELDLYLTMVGEDGWCINYDHHTRKCKIYKQRPLFCRVTPENFERMYQVSAAEFNDFAIDCCLQQIEGVYGNSSREMENYQLNIDS
jgi:Fe-S-cluster containining protein